VARSAIVFPLGTTSVALIQIMSTGEVGVRRHRRVIASSALLCATLVGALGAVAATLALVGRSVPALEGATNWILRVLGNPLFWLAMIVVAVLSRRLLTHGDRTTIPSEGSPA
jgi:tellurite resistance protein TehA-like permease